MSDDQNDEFIPLSAFAMAVGLVPDTVRRMAQRGELRAILRQHGRMFVAATEVERIRESNNARRPVTPIVGSRACGRCQVLEERLRQTEHRLAVMELRLEFVANTPDAHVRKEVEREIWNADVEFKRRDAMVESCMDA